MKHKILTTCFALACSVALLSAQSQQQGNTGSSTSDRNTSQSDRSWDDKSTSKKGTVKMTGCLAAGTQPNTFMLNNASETSQSARSSGQDRSDTSSSTSTPSEMARAESSYVLVSENRNVDLSKHIGKRVEVTGTFDSSRSGHGAHTGSQPGSQSSQSSSSAGTSSSASSSGTVTGQSGMMSEHHQIKVKSIRQIASSCQ